MQIIPQPRAAMLIIGDEILSGKTHDANLPYLATALGEKGIALIEARVVADDEEAIVTALNALRSQYDYVFTTGGIGPTHDDITADCIAKAFGRKLVHDPVTMQVLEAHYAKQGIDFNNARKRMARMPEGAVPITNKASVAPGFQIENVYVMAGVPAIMQAMMQNILPGLKGGTPTQSLTLTTRTIEGTFAAGLTQIQHDHPDTSIGSYPIIEGGKPAGANLVIRSQNGESLRAARGRIETLLRDLGGECRISEPETGIKRAR